MADEPSRFLIHSLHCEDQPQLDSIISVQWLHLTVTLSKGEKKNGTEDSRIQAEWLGKKMQSKHENLGESGGNESQFELKVESKCNSMTRPEISRETSSPSSEIELNFKGTPINH